MTPTFAEAAWLAGAAFVAGWIDAIAGGGGLVTLPALLAAGLPPELALGTNKGQSVFGSSTALVRFAHAGLVDRMRAAPAFVLGLLGAFAGAALVLLVDPKALRPLVLGLLVVVAVFLVVRPMPKPRAVEPGRARAFAGLIALLIGAYDGFFGPGTGTFLILGNVLLAGDSLQRASANAKVVNFASNLAAVSLFAARGTVVWAYALPMAGAQFAGALLGAHTAVRVGDRLVRRVLFLVSGALIARLGWDLLRP